MTLISVRGNLSWLLIIVEHVSLNNAMNERTTTTISIFSVRFALPQTTTLAAAIRRDFLKFYRLLKNFFLRFEWALSQQFWIFKTAPEYKNTQQYAWSNWGEAKKAIKNFAFHCVFSPCLMAMNSELCGASFSLVECFSPLQPAEATWIDIWDC